jgi:hypothetical protein
MNPTHVTRLTTTTKALVPPISHCISVRSHMSGISSPNPPLLSRASPSGWESGRYTRPIASPPMLQCCPPMHPLPQVDLSPLTLRRHLTAVTRAYTACRCGIAEPPQYPRPSHSAASCAASPLPPPASAYARAPSRPVPSISFTRT